MERTTQQSFIISLLIHAGIVGLAVVFLWLQNFLERPEPVVFELVAPAATAPPPARPSPPTPAPEPLKPLEVPTAEPLKPLPEVPDLPPPPPEPPPKPAPKPEPKPEPKKPDPPKTLSYEEWAKTRKLPERVQTVQQPRTKPVAAPEIDTNVRERLRKQLSPIQLQGADIGQIQDSDALQRYLAELRERIQASFEPSGANLQAEAYFTVTATGRITSGRISRSSGDPTFDQSVLRTLQVARSPGPPPGGRDYTFSLVFRSE